MWKGTFLASILLLSVGSAAADRDSSKILAMEKIWNQAELQNDAQALELILSEDFMMTVGDGGTLNKKQTLDSVRDKTYKPTLLQSEHMQVRMHGDAAVVTGAYHEKGTDKGRPFDRRGRFTDTWMFFDNRWQCVASHFSVKPD